MSSDRLAPADVEISHYTNKKPNYADMLINKSFATSHQRSQSVKQPKAGTSMKNRSASPAPRRLGHKCSLWAVMGAPPQLMSSAMQRNPSISDEYFLSGGSKRNTRSGSYNPGQESPEEQERQRLEMLQAGVEDGVVKRLRNFSIDPVNGLVNEGDAFRCTSVTHEVRSTTPSRRYKILVIGSLGVGKDALITQFTTSDQSYPFNHDSIDLSTTPLESPSTSSSLKSPQSPKKSSSSQSSDYQFGDETKMSILLDGEEYDIIISKKDLQRGKMEIYFSRTIDAYLFVYSIDKESSYKDAVSVINDLRAWEARQGIRPKESNSIVILVGNKSDLERRRSVTTDEAKSSAKRRDCKFIEISVAIGHNIDRLLVGTVSQIKRQRIINRSPDLPSTPTYSNQPIGDRGDSPFDPHNELSSKLSKTSIKSENAYRPAIRSRSSQREKDLVKNTKSTGFAGYGSSFSAARKTLMNRISFKKRKVSKSTHDLFFE